MKKTICLNMIVKDEAHIIVKTLKNLTSYIKFDYWIISDTGSTDNTKELIKQFFKKAKIPGELIETPWKNFGYNRTFALEKAYKKTDYVFIFDADDEIYGNFKLPTDLTKDNYIFQYGNSTGIVLTRPQLFNNRKKWEYKGVLHEYAFPLEEVGEPEIVTGDYYFTLGHEGNRSKDLEKYSKDAVILEKAFNENNSDSYLHSRYAYYCAQSYLCCNNVEKAIEFYKKTLELYGWLEEKYVSSFRIYDNIEDKEEGINFLIQASNYNPNRIECIYRLVNYYLLKNQFDRSYDYYKLVQKYYENDYYKNGITGTFLCINVSEYIFYFPYNMIIVSEKIKKYEIGIRMYEIIFKHKFIDVDQFFITHLFSNLEFFYEKVLDKDFFVNMRIYIDLLKENGFELPEVVYNKFINYQVPILDNDYFETIKVNLKKYKTLSNEEIKYVKSLSHEYKNEILDIFNKTEK